ncbi:hypothetical protein TIFTF001_040521 [Ficus carica]|uniref:Semialdehyde dehydrogenase NAD-binding domain-containing protein n=1 Tax=Ficus carica TaxID=3494 RepID=A0AA87ZFY3_FICCA|nr:hypothetical protein TIFTF001_040521 [Ficus carica]
MGSAAFSSFGFDTACLWKDQMKVAKAEKRNAGKVFVKCSVKAQKVEKSVRIGVLGASGYTGSEIVRLLANHPHFGINLLTADRKAGQSIGSVFPHLITQDLPNMVAIKDADFSSVDAVFCCLPHGTTQCHMLLVELYKKDRERIVKGFLYFPHLLYKVYTVSLL